MQGYREDLAYIHDAGFSHYSLGAAPGLLRLLRREGVTAGLVVDLGCGSGHWAQELSEAGYRVLGVDQSSAMIRLARRKSPESEFRAASLWSFPLPACDAVTSIGECLNYRSDSGDGRKRLRTLFQRIHGALRAGGVFLFDLAGPGRILDKHAWQYWREGDGWTVLVTNEALGGKKFLERYIVCFRRMGRRFRRSEEVHLLRLYRTEDVVAELERCGFDVRVLESWGRFALPAGLTAFAAVKRSGRRGLADRGAGRRIRGSAPQGR